MHNTREPRASRWMLRALALLAAASGLLASAPAAGAEPFTVRTLHFATVVGPNDDQHCDVIADLYRPASATAGHPEPAMLMTNGFGGSKDDQAGIAKAFAANGYVALSYSGLGFGGSGCKISLDSPDFDGKAASQLISFLGGSRAAVDGTRVDYVKRDAVAHDGRAYPDDPRVGMIGGSYGGEIQFATAAVDPRLDTIVPIITWNDLSYSIFPNNADLVSGVTSGTPGVLKWIWGLLFTADGSVVDGLLGPRNDNGRLTGCPNFVDEVCAGLAGSLLGAPTPALQSLLRHASVATYMDRIRIPVMLWQGERDTLFNLNESVATYDALRARRVPVKLLWQSWGHSYSKPAPGEIDRGDAGGLLSSYQGHVAVQWFEHYLKDAGPTPAFDFSYFRPWVTYQGNDAAAAYGSSPAYPAATSTRLYLSAPGNLVDTPAAVSPGQTSFVTPPVNGPTSLSEISALNDSAFQHPAPFDLPGTVATFSTQALATDTDVVGIPKLRLRLSAPLAIPVGGAGADGELTLFAKLYDVAPDGTATLPDARVSPVRIADPGAPVEIQLPGLVHRFARGHRLQLVVSGADLSYRGSPVGQPVAVLADRLSAIELPVLGPVAARAGAAAKIRYACSGRGAAQKPCRFSTPSGNIRCVWRPRPESVTCELLASHRAYRLRPTGRAVSVKARLRRRGETLPTSQMLVFPRSLSCHDTATTMTCNQNFGSGAFRLAARGSRRS